MSMLTKWNPFRTVSKTEDRSAPVSWGPTWEIDRMQSDMNRLMNRVLRGGLFPFTPGEEALTTADWAPRVDIAEDAREFVVKAELPEVKKEDVKVTLDDNILTIRGERHAQKEETGKRYHRIERSYGSFERSFAVPDATNGNKISSEFKNGMLTVHLPKDPTARPRAVEIEVK